MAKKTASQGIDDRVHQLKPEDILADDNIRFSIRPGDVKRLQDSIVELGGVQEPISVELRTDAKAGEPRYRLLKGFIRHAAVTGLNKDQAAGLTLPALVRITGDETARLKTQIAENVARAALTPMDTAISIQRLVDAGVPKVDIRQLFIRSGTGKGKVSPMSNAWLNAHLAMLELPKGIQAKIHDGSVGVWGAYELTRCAPDRREAILERAEGEITSQLEREEKDEAKVLKEEQKAQAETQKQAQAAEALEQAKADVTTAEGLVAEKTATLRLVQAEEYDPTDKGAQAAYKEKLGAAETDVKAAQQIGKKAKNKVAKLIQEASPAEEVEKPKAKATVGKTAVQKAAKADAKATGTAPAAAHAKLSASEIRQALKDIGKSKSAVVQDVVAAFSSCFDGVDTPKQTMELLEKIVAGPKAPAKK